MELVLSGIDRVFALVESIFISVSVPAEISMSFSELLPSATKELHFSIGRRNDSFSAGNAGGRRQSAYSA